MVTYCCVKGCGNSSVNKKKNPNDITSFHTFPSNLELKHKWLRAIGRPNWEPPSHARICSAHFNYDQIDHEKKRMRIKDNACPVNALPPNSNFEASYLEVCRICLATDLKMYNLSDGVLKTYMESVVGLNESYILEGLPHFICFECTAHLKKCYHLIEKSMLAQTTLLDIFAQNGQITKHLVISQNIQRLKPSTLSCHKILPSSFIEMKYDEQSETFLAFNLGTDEENNMEKCHVDFKMNEITDNTTSLKSEIDLKEITDFKFQESCFDDVIDNNKSDSQESDGIDNDENSFNSIDLKINTFDDIDYNNAGKIEQYNNEDKIDKVFIVENVPEKQKEKRRNRDGLTPEEIKMQQHFRVVKLTLQEQSEEWIKRFKDKKLFKSGSVYECKICLKVFAHYNTYKRHMDSHDPSRGKVECPVCKLRFKNDVLARSHANRRHGKKFYCMSCPKVFNNVGTAKQHRLRHVGHVYRCARCPYGSVHAAAASAHARTHAGGGTDVLGGSGELGGSGVLGSTAMQGSMNVQGGTGAKEDTGAQGGTGAQGDTCARCGRAFLTKRGLMLHYSAAHAGLPISEGSQEYHCKQCNVNFISEGARRVHILTSSQHKRRNDLCDSTPLDPTVKNSCSKCGIQLQSLSELRVHVKTNHPRPSQKTSWRLPDDKFPTKCEHCDKIVNNRKEHWQHVRRQHPKEKSSYRPVITAVCPTCGKGFQNSTKLRVHELRHSSSAGGSVRCEQCARTFHDKYALARHRAVHEPTRPHRCALCAAAFKLRANLHRHYRVCVTYTTLHFHSKSHFKM